jgi:hypothetical protein
MDLHEFALSRRSLGKAAYLHQYHIFEVAQTSLKTFLEDVSNAERLHPSLEDVPAF